MLINGKEVDCYQNLKVGKMCAWLPFILGAPFLNLATGGRSMLDSAIDELLEDVKTYRR